MDLDDNHWPSDCQLDDKVRRRLDHYALVLDQQYPARPLDTKCAQAGTFSVEDPMTTCPTCGELKRVTISVAAPSERLPLPVWRYRCKACDHSWTKDENEPRPEPA